MHIFVALLLAFLWIRRRMMDDDTPLFSMEESEKQLETLLEAGIIQKEQLKELGIRTTLIRNYCEKEEKDKINKEAYLKIDEAIRQRYNIYSK